MVSGFKSKENMGRNTPGDFTLKEVSVSEIADIFIGGTPKTTIKEYWNGDIPWATAKDVANCKSRYVRSTENKITSEGVENSAAKILPKTQ